MKEEERRRLERHFKGNAVRQMVRSSEDGSFFCGICAKGYKQRGHLVNHIRREHEKGITYRAKQLAKKALESDIQHIKEFIADKISRSQSQWDDHRAEFYNYVEERGFTSAFTWKGVEMLEAERRYQVIKRLKELFNGAGDDWEKKLEILLAVTEDLKERLIQHPTEFNSTSVLSNVARMYERKTDSDLLSGFGFFREVERGIRSILEKQKQLNEGDYF